MSMSMKNLYSANSRRSIKSITLR